MKRHDEAAVSGCTTPPVRAGRSGAREQLLGRHFGVKSRRTGASVIWSCGDAGGGRCVSLWVIITFNLHCSCEIEVLVSR